MVDHVWLIADDQPRVEGKRADREQREAHHASYNHFPSGEKIFPRGAGGSGGVGEELASIANNGSPTNGGCPPRRIRRK